MNEIALLIAATIASGTPLALAGLGLLINEKAGILNLGAEGMMLVAAVAGFAAAFHSGNQWVAFAAGAGAGMILAAGFGVLVIWLKSNEYATGLALSLFGFGFSAFVGVEYVGKKLGDHVPFAVPFLADIPFLGPALFKQHPLAYVAMALAAALAWFLYRSRQGLVRRDRRVARLGALARLHRALDPPRRSGCGRRALRRRGRDPVGRRCAAVGRRAGRRPRLDRARADAVRHLAPGAGAARRVPLRRGDDAPVQPAGGGRADREPVPVMLPYIATIVVLALISRNPAWIRINMPASLGKPFHPSA